MTYILLAGIAAGIIAASMSMASGFGWAAVIGFYVLGGNIGLLLTGLLVAHSRGVRDTGQQVSTNQS